MMETLGNRLIQLRKRYRYTQQEIANILDLTDGAYWHYEQDSSMPSATKLVSLANLFHTSVQYLVTGVEAENSYDEENVTAFSERVKTLRKERHMTQKQVAAELGIRYTAYQAYEYGKSEPNLDHLLQLADLFDVTLDELLGRNKK